MHGGHCYQRWLATVNLLAPMATMHGIRYLTQSDTVTKDGYVAIVNIPTPIVSKYVQSSEVGKMASSVHITTSHRHSFITTIYRDGLCYIICCGTNIDGNCMRYQIWFKNANQKPANNVLSYIITLKWNSISV